LNKVRETYSLDEKEMSAIAGVLSALNSHGDTGFGFLPLGYSNERDQETIPMLEVFDADVLLGSIVWSGDYKFLYVPSVRPVESPAAYDARTRIANRGHGQPDRTSETKEQFITRYQKGCSFPDIFENKIALPCDCDDGGGPTHWSAVSRDPDMVKTHLELYAPSGTPWPDEIPRPERTSL